MTRGHYDRARYKRYRDAGRCVRCGRPSGGPAYCVLHAQANRDQCNARYQRLRDEGKCTQCTGPATPGMHACDGCLDWLAERPQRRSA